MNQITSSLLTSPKPIIIDKEIDALAKSLIASLEKLREWLDEQKKEGHSNDVEFMMLLEMLDSGVAYLSVVAEIMITLYSMDGVEKLEYKLAVSDIIKRIKGFVKIVKIAAFNEE